MNCSHVKCQFKPIFPHQLLILITIAHNESQKSNDQNEHYFENCFFVSKYTYVQKYADRIFLISNFC